MRELNITGLFLEIDSLRKRIESLAIQEPSSDFPLIDPTNGNHLNDNTATFPADWTQADSPQTTATNEVKGFWSIIGSSGNAAWKYQKQTPFNIESLSVNAYKSFHLGPIYIKESLPTADLNYYLGIYRNNAGAIDENTFIRININWSSASSIWQARAERKDGTTQTNGTYYTLPRAPIGQLWARVALRNSTNKDVFGYIGSTPYHLMHMQLMNATVGAGVTWGQVWWQFHMSRGTGPDDRIMIGGYDYSDNT